MRKRWTERAVWSRQHLVALVAGSPDAGAAAARLLRNHEDVGASLVPYFGQGVGDALTKLLGEQMELVAKTIAAAKARDEVLLAQLDLRGAENAEAIADLLASANARWPFQDVLGLLSRQHALLCEQVVARVDKDWDLDARAFDATLVEADAIADLLSDGLAHEFPDRFTVS